MEIVWAAGLFEGEGCFTIHKQGTSKTRKTACAEVYLESTDEDVVRRFANAMGIGTVYDARSRDGRKPTWRWRLTKQRDVRQVIEMLYPHLGTRRRAKAEELLALLRTQSKWEDK